MASKGRDSGRFKLLAQEEQEDKWKIGLIFRYYKLQLLDKKKGTVRLSLTSRIGESY